MPIHECGSCGRHGRLGNLNRTYVTISRRSVCAEEVLCFKCFTAKRRYIRRHKTGSQIIDKVQTHAEMAVV